MEMLGTLQIIVIVIVIIVLGLVLGFVLKKNGIFKGRKIFKGGYIIAPDDDTYIKNNNYNDETKSKFIEIIKKYPCDESTIRIYYNIFQKPELLIYNLNTKDLFNKFIEINSEFDDKEEDVYCRIEIYELIFENNKYNINTHELYNMIIENITYEQNNICHLYDNIFHINQYNINTHELYNMIIDKYSYINARDLYTIIIMINPYNINTHELYNMIIDKNTYNDFTFILYDFIIKTNSYHNNTHDLYKMFINKYDYNVTSYFLYRTIINYSTYNNNTHDLYKMIIDRNPNTFNGNNNTHELYKFIIKKCPYNSDTKQLYKTLINENNYDINITWKFYNMFIENNKYTSSIDQQLLDSLYQYLFDKFPYNMNNSSLYELFMNKIQYNKMSESIYNYFIDKYGQFNLNDDQNNLENEFFFRRFNKIEHLSLIDYIYQINNDKSDIEWKCYGNIISRTLTHESVNDHKQINKLFRDLNKKYNKQFINYYFDDKVDEDECEEYYDDFDDFEY